MAIFGYCERHLGTYHLEAVRLLPRGLQTRLEVLLVHERDEPEAARSACALLEADEGFFDGTLRVSRTTENNELLEEVLDVLVRPGERESADVDLPRVLRTLVLADLHGGLLTEARCIVLRRRVLHLNGSSLLVTHEFP